MSLPQPMSDKRQAAADASAALEVLGASQRSALEAYSRTVAPAEMYRFQRFIARQTAIYTESAALSATLARQVEVLPSEIVSSLNDSEVFWRGIQEEFSFLNSLEVATRLGASANRSYASDLRKAGKLVGLQRLNKFVYPGFQFRDGSITPVIARLTKLARDRAMDDRDIIAWLCRPTTYIRGDARRPVDHLDDVDLVVAAASSAWDVVW